MARGKRWALYVLAATLVGLLNFGIVAATWLTEHNRHPLRYPLLWEMTGVYTLLLLLPLMLYLMRRFPLDGAHRARNLCLHAVAMPAIGATHTLLMFTSRTALYALLGWGHFDYGDWRFRFLMEGLKQLVGYVLIFATVTLVSYVQRNRQRELASARLAEQLTAARLAALKMQLNPHFLFNTLNMIAAHVHDQPATAEEMIAHLSDFLRLTLRERDAQEVPLEQELAFLNAYLAIMRARFSDRLQVDVTVQPEARQALVPHLLLQPLVENSIEHCLEATGRGRVQIRAEADARRCRLAIEDDGPGIDGPMEEALGKGVGLSNTAERLRHLYGGDHRLALSNVAGGGLRLDIDLPLRKVVV